MLVKRVLATTLLCAMPLFSGDRDPTSIQSVVRSASGDVTQYLVALPHIAFGGAWRTRVVIRNVGNADADVTLFYFSNGGSPLGLPFNGVLRDNTNITIPAGGMREVVPDAQGPESVAWAGLVYTSANLKIQGVFQWHNSADPADKNTEAVAPVILQSTSACILAVPGSAGYSMPYDETDGGSSGYGFANTTSVPVTLNLTFYDSDGQIAGVYAQVFPGFGHDQFLVRDKVPLLAGKKGSMMIRGEGIVPLGFRFKPYNTFTTWLP